MQEDAAQESDPKFVSENEDEHYHWSCTTTDKETEKPVPDVRIAWEFRGAYSKETNEYLSLWKKEFISDREGKYKVSVPKPVVDASRNVSFGVAIYIAHPKYLPRNGDYSYWPLRMPDDPVGQGLDHRHAQLEPGIRVSGQILKPDGSPARNLPIMFGRNRSGFGDSNGGYRHGFWTGH